VSVISRPILFNGEMVRAILSGQKTQTRRVIKDQPPWQNPIVEPSNGAGTWGHHKEIDWGDPEEPKWSCPYGIPGQQLWVRETWRPSFWSEDFDMVAIEYWADGKISNGICSESLWPDDDRRESVWENLSSELNKANCPTDHNGNYNWSETGNPLKLRLSIFMPRAASRITLEILDVRVERLKSISEADAIAEGVERDGDLWKCYGNCGDHKAGYHSRTSATASYMSLWDSINKKRGCGWDANPWVWVVEFKKLEVA
jgi:hypothetical protein